MKGMPLTFEDFQGKGLLLDFSSSSSSSSSSDSLLHHQKHQPLEKWQPATAATTTEELWCYARSSFSEPRSVLEASRRSSPPTSSSTLSSSQGPVFTPGGGGTSTDTATTGLAPNNNNDNPSPERCPHLGMEDWESVLSIGGGGSATGGSSSPSQEQSILRLIMGDMEDPSLGLGPHPDFVEFGNNAACFGMVDHHQVFNFDATAPGGGGGNDPSSLHGNASSSSTSPDFPGSGSVLDRIGSLMSQMPGSNPGGFPAGFSPGLFQQEQQMVEDEKPQILNPMIINQSQAQFTQNPALFLPLSFQQLQEHQHQHLLSPPPPKRLHSGGGPISAQPHKVPFSDSRPELFLQRQQLQMLQQHQQRSPGMVNSCNAMGSGNGNTNGNSQQIQLQLQQAIINPICQAAELIESGNPILAQGILARLNHQLSLPMGKPSHRAAFYFKEALQLLVHLINTNSLGTGPTSLSTCSLIFKIGAYKSFSEISPVLQFANFTCNQALLEAFEGFDRIHIVDFDLGYGGQWASLMQELALRSGDAPSLKITAFASPYAHDELELGLTQENLELFAREINMPFELEILSLESLASSSWPMMTPRLQDKELVAVNLPMVSFSSYPASLPLVIRFVKHLSPKIVVSLDRGCDRTDLPFAHNVNIAIQSYSSLLESLDAVNVNPDALQKIERFLVQPEIEKLVLGRQRCPDRILSWRSLFLQSGFTPLTFSNIAESQAECLVQRTPVRGFHVEKRQSSLILFWQRKELISASAWRC